MNTTPQAPAPGNPRIYVLRLSRWQDGHREELAPIRIATVAEQHRRETTRRRQFLPDFLNLETAVP